MEEKKHVLDYAAQTLVIFGITLLVISLICYFYGDAAKSYSSMFVLGSAGIPLKTILQYLLSSACITGLRILFFTDKIIRKLSIAKRMVAMLLSIVCLIGLLAYLFGWFPVNNPKCWAAFFISFGICFLISISVSALKESMDNRLLADGLAQLKESPNDDVD